MVSTCVPLREGAARGGDQEVRRRGGEGRRHVAGHRRHGLIPCSQSSTFKRHLSEEAHLSCFNLLTTS